MKRKFAGICFLAFCVLYLSACSIGGFSVSAPPRNIYKDYIDVNNTQSLFEEQVASLRAGSIVSIISSGGISAGRGGVVTTRVFSGVIFSQEGYVITSSDAYNMTVEYEGKIYTGKADEVYAVLSDVYNDQKHYRLVLVDCNEDIELAIFRFYDTFYYYKDGSAQQGFQFVADFSAKAIQTGNRVLAIGNSLGNVLAGGNIKPSGIRDVRLTATSGIIAENETNDPKPLSYKNKDYKYFIVNQPVNPEMYGGGIFDESGYLIGIIAAKLMTETATGKQEILSRLSTAFSSSLLMDYINDVSQSLQISMPYTVAGLRENK